MRLGLADRLTPVLVKEVRQAVRGRLFNVGFSVSLVTAATFAGVSLLEGGGENGRRAVMPIFAVLAAALLYFVPFYALQVMRQELDEEGARDLLALSPLGAWRVVVGKALAAFVVAALLVSAFAPFLTFVALLPSVDTFGLGSHLVHLLGMSTFLAAIGVAAGATRTNRAGKGASNVLLGVITTFVFAVEVRFAEQRLVGAEPAQHLAFVAFGWLTFAASAPLFLGLGAAALARDDREVSHGLRVAWVVAALATTLQVTVVLPALGAPGSAVLQYGVVATLAGALVGGVVATEGPGLDRDGRDFIARGRSRGARVARGLLVVGGGRGVLLTFAIGGLLCAGTLVGCSLANAGTLAGSRAFASAGTPTGPAVLIALTALGSSVAFSVLPGRALLYGRSGPTARRNARRVTMGLLLGLSVFMPLLVLVSTRARAGEDAFLLSPAFVLLRAAEDVGRGSPLGGGVLLWGLIGAFGVAMALGSAWRGLGEVLDVPAAPRGDGH